MSLPFSPTSAHSFAGRPTRSRICLGKTEIVEFTHRIGLQVDPYAERAHIPDRFEDNCLHANLMKRQRCRQTANAATGDDYWMVHCGAGFDLRTPEHLSYSIAPEASRVITRRQTSALTLAIMAALCPPFRTPVQR